MSQAAASLRTIPRGAWAVLLVAGVVGTVVTIVLAPTEPFVLVDVFAFEALSVGAVAWFVLTARPRPVIPWVVLLAGFGVQLAANVLYAIGGGFGSAPGSLVWLDAAYVTAYATVAVAFALIARSLGAGRDRGDVVDGSIIALGFGIVAWALPLGDTLVAAPTASAAKFEAVAFPVVDLAILATALVIFFRIGRVNASIVLVGTALGAQLLADTFFAYGDLGNVPAFRNMAAPLSLLAFASFGAAMLHPAAAAYAHAMPTGLVISPRFRLALLALTALVASSAAVVANAFDDGSIVDSAIEILAGLIVILFAVRVWIMASQLTRTDAALAKTRADLGERRRFLEEIEEATPGILFSGDLRTRSLDYASPGLQEVLGLGTAEDVRQPGWFLERLHPDDAAALFDRSQAAITAGRTTETFDARMLAADGTERILEARVRYIGEPGHPADRYVGVGLDVTERVAIERRLTERDSFIADIARASRAILFAGRGRFGANAAFDFVSPSVEWILGYTPDEVVREPGILSRGIHPDEDTFVDAVSKALARGEAVPEMVRRYRAKDGTYRSLFITSSVAPEPDGSLRFVASAIDITDRIRLEEQLAEARSFAEEVVATSPGVILTGRLAPPVVDFASPGVEGLLGYRRDEIVGVENWFTQHVHPDDIEAHLEAIRRTVAAGGGEVTRTFRIRTPDGEYRTLLYTVRLAADGRYVGSGIDITETLAAQTELAGARRLVDDIIATTPGMIVRGSFLSGTVDYVSPGIREILGYEPEEVVGVVGWMAAHRHPDDAPARDDAVRAAMSGSQSRFTLVDRLRTKSGEWRSLLEIVNLVDPDDPSLGYVATAIDITERVRMEEELRAARDAAQAADRSKSEFLSIVSHELRNPLNAILGHGELLDHAGLSADDRESLDFVLAGGRRLLGLINRMLDYARLETGRLHVASQPVILDDVVRSALDHVQGLAQEQKVVVLRAPDSETGLAASADAPRLIQVVEDLVDNAVRHGGPDVHVSVRTHAGHDGRVAISVEDDGVGIPEEQLGRVFAPLERDSAGTGATLGLALARRLVEAMGGTISIASTVGVGTVATVEVPALGDTVEADAAEGVGSGVR